MHARVHPPQGEEVEAGFDAAAEAAAAARRLQEADVVLTSFDVLRAEVGWGGQAHAFILCQQLRCPNVKAFQHRSGMPPRQALVPWPSVAAAPPPPPCQVYFMPSTRSFRRPKKYAVPHCPLLQVGQHTRAAAQPAVRCLSVACCLAA